MKVALRSAPGEGREAWAYTGGKAFDPSLPVVVFVHGALHDHSVWTLAARWFAHHGRAALAVDLPGHGRSGGAPLDSIERIADWLVAVLDVAGVRRAALVGHSMGSLVALEAAARRPELATHLVMVGTAYPMAVAPALLDAARDDPLAAIDSVNAWSHSSLAAKPSYPGPGAWLHGANRALMRRVQAGRSDVNVFSNDFTACDRYRGGDAAAAKVRCPVAFVVGSRDQMTRTKDAAALAKALDARVVELAAGHALMSEAPDAVIAAVDAAVR